MKKKIVEAETRVEQGFSPAVKDQGKATPLPSKGQTRVEQGLSPAIKDQGQAPSAKAWVEQTFRSAITHRDEVPSNLPKARMEFRAAAPLLSKGHGLSRAVTNPREARTLLPQAAPTRKAAKAVPLCKYIHLDGRRCQSPVHRKARTAEVGLCFQHAIRTRLHRVMEARRAANALRAQLDLKLSPARRAQRAIDDQRARAIRPFAHIPLLNTYANIDRARQNIEYAAAVGAFDVRTTRILLNTLRVAALAIKHTPGEQKEGPARRLAQVQQDFR